MEAEDPRGENGLPAASVRDAARRDAYDRYLAALLAPAEARGDLVVLAAYLGELMRIPLAVRDAAIGEIRFAWWRDALEAPYLASGHPVVDAVLETAQRRGLARPLLLAPVEGFARELYEDGIRDAGELDHYAEQTQGSILRLATAILGGKDAEMSAGAVENAARALALTHLALSLPQHLAHGRLPLPPEYGGGAARDLRSLGGEAGRDAARAVVQALATDALQALDAFRIETGRDAPLTSAAFLPLALVKPYLAAATKPGRDVLTEVADISPLSCVVRLWWAHWRGTL